MSSTTKRESGASTGRRRAGLSDTRGCATKVAAPENDSNATSWTFLIDEREAARACGVCRQTFRTWKNAGLITPVPLPFNLHRNLYRPQDVAALVDRMAGA